MKTCVWGVLGCTSSIADNHLADAEVDDGSCAIGGCTNRDAPSWDPLATFDDGGDPASTLELLRRVPTAGEEGLERRYYEPL